MRALGEVATIKIIENFVKMKVEFTEVENKGSLNKVPYGKPNFSINFPCGPENAEN